jgi:hypothetical protein
MDVTAYRFGSVLILLFSEEKAYKQETKALPTLARVVDANCMEGRRQRVRCAGGDGEVRGEACRVEAVVYDVSGVVAESRNLSVVLGGAPGSL